MANVINRTTCEYLESVNTPDFSVLDWIINPDLSAVSGVPMKYWKCSGDSVVEMSQAEKDTVDAAEAASQAASRNGFILDHAFHDNNKPYADSYSASYKIATVFIWPGSNLVGVPKQINFVAKKSNPSSSGYIRVYDSTNDVSWGELEVTEDELGIVSMTSMSNISDTKSMLEIQIKKLALSSVSFEF